MGAAIKPHRRFLTMALMPDPTSLNREQALYMAKLAEQAERYEDMVKYMKQIVELGIKAHELTVEERNLLSVGYKNMMSVRRTAWRTVQQICESGEECPALNPVYRDTIAKEVFALITEVCEDVVKRYVDGDNKDDDEKVEVLVFFKKMEGDYNRYGAEITEGDQKETYKQAAKKAYTSAQDLAAQLPSTNPIRLGLALNFSVFHYEICDAGAEAKELAKNAFDTAIDHLDALEDDEYKDSTLIMQLLKDNLTLWTSDNDNEENQDELEVVDVDH